MKNHVEIVEQIKKNAEKVRELEEKAKNAKYSQRNEPEIVKAYQDAELLRIENKVLHDNARQALFAEALPVILEELHKFSGKPYGEKTEKKISEAIKARISCAVYIRREYTGDTLHMIPLDKNGFSGTGVWSYDDFDVVTVWHGGERARVLIDNKLQDVAPEEFRLSNCGEYVENTREQAEKIRAAFEDMKKARAEYERKISAFNALLPSGIERTSRGEYRNYIF